MINDLKKVDIFLFFLLIWLFPLVNNYQVLIFIFCYTASVFSQLFIKNKGFAFLFAIVSLFFAVINDIQYLFFSIFPFFSLFEYIQIIKNKKKDLDRIYIGSNASVLIGVVVILYHSLSGDTTYKIKNDESLTVIWAMFFLFLSLGAVCLSKKTHWKQVSTEHALEIGVLKKLQYIHFLNILCFIESIILFFFFNTLNYSERIYFFPWILYLEVMIYCNDPMLAVLLKKSEDIFNSFATNVK